MSAFNLITTPWLEVRRASGVREVICPHEITDGFETDPILALDFPRPDWNAAVTEWLIGMMFLSSPPYEVGDWAERFEEVPSPATLQAELAPLVPYFNLDGDGPRAFQDFETLDNHGKIKSCSALLIDAAGENTEEKNADLFVKRQNDMSLTLGYASAALITLQTYAPSQGKGYRTSLRGGGPLTTLVAPVREGRSNCTLWDCVWANTPELDQDAGADPRGALPWLRETATSEGTKAPVVPEGQHPALAFFACPRRIRLEFSQAPSGYRVSSIRTLNYGANYTSWVHPLSPYRNDKDAGKLPLHPKAGASSYGDWIAWWGFKDLAQPTPATCLALWKHRLVAVEGLLDRTLVGALGYDMDNAKARQWLEARLPWVSAHEGELRNSITQSIGAADATARSLRLCVKLALYGQRKDDGYKLPDNLPKDVLAEAGDIFWQETEPAFRLLLDRMIERLGNDTRSATSDLKREWLTDLRDHAMRIFDASVDMDGLTDHYPRRLLYARGQLQIALSEQPKSPVLKALGLDPSVTVQKSPPAKSRRA
jgi:CRISPR system Cascade subunit CasA